VTGAPRLTVNYLLEDTELFGGVKVPLHHANLLHRRGHRVRVLSRGPLPDWYPLEAAFGTVPGFSADTVPEADVHVATFWTTIAPAAALPHGRPVHYCQGFEASYTHNLDEHAQILEAYARPLPAFALSPHLAELVRSRFGRPARVVPPALERMWRPRWRWRPARRPRVVVAHPFEVDWKGVATALEAVRRLRAGGVTLTLVRVSQWPLSDAERALVEPDEFHCRIDPPAVARLIAGCDLMLAPSWEQEGFGLPVLEAMACGVPVVASDVGGNREVVCTPQLGRVVSFGDREALSRAIDDALRTDWDRAAIRRHAERNDWQQRVSTLLDEFRRLAPGSNGRGRGQDTHHG